LRSENSSDAPAGVPFQRDQNINPFEYEDKIANYSSDVAGNEEGMANDTNQASQ